MYLKMRNCGSNCNSAADLKKTLQSSSEMEFSCYRLQQITMVNLISPSVSLISDQYVARKWGFKWIFLPTLVQFSIRFNKFIFHPKAKPKITCSIDVDHMWRHRFLERLVQLGVKNFNRGFFQFSAIDFREEFSNLVNISIDLEVI